MLCTAGAAYFDDFPCVGTCTGPSAAEKECNLVSHSMLLISMLCLKSCCALSLEKLGIF